MADELELNADGTPKTATKVEFTPEQQEAINKIFNDRFAKTAAKHEREKEEYAAKKLREAEEARLASTNNNEVKNELTNNNAKPEDAQREEFKQLLDNEKNKAKLAEEARKRAEDEAKAAKAEALNVKKTQAMYNAMSGKSFFQPTDILKLTEDKIVYDSESGTFVVKENGVIKQNSSLQNMTLDEYYAEVAASRPYLVNGDIKSGVGSRESSASPNAGLVKTKADLKTTRDKSEYIAKFGLDKYSELPSK